jgi:hypothetical protein
MRRGRKASMNATWNKVNRKKPTEIRKGRGRDALCRCMARGDTTIFG